MTPPIAQVTPLPLTLVAAVARNGVIGADDGLPWRVPSDLRHFRAVTMDRPVLMGRKTYASIGRPLPGRHLVVLSADARFTPEGVAVARSLDEALRTAEGIGRDRGAPEIVVAGGGMLYRALIGVAQRLEITEIDCAPAGDTCFPAIEPAVWRAVRREAGEPSPRDEASFAFVTYVRRADPYDDVTRPDVAL